MLDVATTRGIRGNPARETMADVFSDFNAAPVRTVSRRRADGSRTNRDQRGGSTATVNSLPRRNPASRARRMSAFSLLKATGASVRFGPPARPCCAPVGSFCCHDPNFRERRFLRALSRTRVHGLRSRLLAGMATPAGCREWSRRHHGGNCGRLRIGWP